MGGCHSTRKHTEEDPNSLEDYKITSESNPSLADGKEPPSFEELCARQQELVARSEGLKNAVAQQTQRRSFRSELADIVLKGPRRSVQPSEENEESQAVEDGSEPGPATPRVKLSYRRRTLDGTTSPDMKAVVDRYFDTLEELKRFVVSDEIYLDRKSPSKDDEAADEQDLKKEETAEEDDDFAAKERTEEDEIIVESSPAAASEALVDQAVSSASNTEDRNPNYRGEKNENSAENLGEESSFLQSTPEKKNKKKKRVKGKKSKKRFSCFSSEDCE